jgi:fructokinase
MERKVYGIGETILDIIFSKNKVQAAKPGGSAFNTLISLGRMKVNANLISEFGNDNAGNLIENFLNENGVNIDHVNRFRTSKTPISLAFLGESGDADYSFYKDYPNLRLKNIEPEFTENDIVVFGSYYSLNPVLRDKIVYFIEKAKEANAIILYDPNFRSSHFHERDVLKDAVEWNMKQADIVRASNEDIYNIYEETELKDQFKLLKSKARHLIITANKYGAHYANKRISCSIESDNIRPISTIGAGDSFNAGIIYSLIRKDIYKKDLFDLDNETWEYILNTAKTFSTNCCLSMDNYVDFGL